jgi:hypothetical protein
LSLGTYQNYRVRSGWFFGDDNLFYPCINSYNPYTKNPLNRAIIKNIEVLYNNWITLLDRSLETISLYIYILNDSITYFNASELREIATSNSSLIIYDKVNEMLNINNSKFIISSRVNAYNATIFIAIKSYQLSTILSTIINSEVTR